MLALKHSLLNLWEIASVPHGGAWPISLELSVTDSVICVCGGDCKGGMHKHISVCLKYS